MSGTRNGRKGNGTKRVELQTGSTSSTPSSSQTAVAPINIKRTSPHPYAPLPTSPQNPVTNPAYPPFQPLTTTSNAATPNTATPNTATPNTATPNTSTPFGPSSGSSSYGVFGNLSLGPDAGSTQAAQMIQSQFRISTKDRRIFQPLTGRGPVVAPRGTTRATGREDDVVTLVGTPHYSNILPPPNGFHRQPEESLSGATAVAGSYGASSRSSTRYDPRTTNNNGFGGN